ncbi:MAG: hypothetical protein MI755_09845 [Sphingomonadales bacterium]|nr:hypothetical protein [Sphingomonadales bacterium]
MNWEAIGAIGETLGAAGVIVTLVYLALQIRLSNRDAEAASFKNTLALSISSFHEMIKGENGDVIMNGLLDYDDLAGREKLVFDNVMNSWFTVIASALFARERDLVDDEGTENLSYLLRTRFFPYSGIHAWWSESKEMFRPEARRWFEQEMSKADMESDFYGIRSVD